MSKFQVIVPLEPENPDGDKSMLLEPTENYNFVSLRIDGHWYDVDIAELYRATIPFMDLRHEGRSNEE